MPAPDVPPPMVEGAERPTFVHGVPAFVEPARLSGGVVIVVDALRASVTVAAALAAGATEVRVCLSVDEARAEAERRRRHGERPVLGGERGGVRIEGFDLDNSPAAYTPATVGGRSVVFTTTNGTAALLHAAPAEAVVVGSLVNVGAVCRAARDRAGPVHVVCAGTGGGLSLDDCLAAGAIVERLMADGFEPAGDDTAGLCLAAWRITGGDPDRVLRAMLDSRGGRNLHELGLAADVEFCSRLDSLPVVPIFDPASRSLRLA